MSNRPDSITAATGGGASALPPSFRFADLCAGIGGMRIPFEARGGQCVVTAEIDRQCLITYAANFTNSEEHRYAGDLRRIDPDRLPDFNLLLAGFPCQAFSKPGISKLRSLGKAEGFENPDSGHVFSLLAGIIDAKRPAVFLLENVRNLGFHDGGRTIAVIMQTLEVRLGYTVYARVVDAAPWVPQSRERVFIVGFREPRDFDFSQLNFPPEPHPVLANILEPAPDPKYTLTNAQWASCLRHAEQTKAKGTEGFAYEIFYPMDISCTLLSNYLGGKRPLIADDPSCVGPELPPRRLTPREASRLMGFDTLQGSDWQIPVSDRQAYMQFGNAVVPPVVAAIADLILLSPAPLQPRLPLAG